MQVISIVWFLVQTIFKQIVSSVKYLHSRMKEYKKNLYYKTLSAGSRAKIYLWKFPNSCVIKSMPVKSCRYSKGFLYFILANVFWQKLFGWFYTRHFSFTFQGWNVVSFIQSCTLWYILIKWSCLNTLCLFCESLNRRIIKVNM